MRQKRLSRPPFRSVTLAPRPERCVQSRAAGGFLPMAHLAHPALQVRLRVLRSRALRASLAAFAVGASLAALFAPSVAHAQVYVTPYPPPPPSSSAAPRTTARRASPPPRYYRREPVTLLGGRDRGRSRRRIPREHVSSPRRQQPYGWRRREDSNRRPASPRSGPPASLRRSVTATSISTRATTSAMPIRGTRIACSPVRASPLATSSSRASTATPATAGARPEIPRSPPPAAQPSTSAALSTSGFCGNSNSGSTSSGRPSTRSRTPRSGSRWAGTSTSRFAPRAGGAGGASSTARAATIRARRAAVALRGDSSRLRT